MSKIQEKINDKNAENAIINQCILYAQKELQTVKDNSFLYACNSKVLKAIEKHINDHILSQSKHWNKQLQLFFTQNKDKIEIRLHVRINQRHIFTLAEVIDRNKVVTINDGKDLYCSDIDKLYDRKDTGICYTVITDMIPVVLLNDAMDANYIKQTRKEAMEHLVLSKMHKEKFQQLRDLVKLR